MRILLGGIPLGCDNVGDEAIAACVITLLQQRLPRVHLALATADGESATRLGVTPAPLYGFRTSLAAFDAAIREYDAYIWCGATGLSDYPSLALDLLEHAQRAGKPTFIWGVGMDDELNPVYFKAHGKRRQLLDLLHLTSAYEASLQRKINARLRHGLSACQAIYVRDPETRQELLRRGVSCPVEVTADTAILQRSAATCEVPPAPGVQTIGLCISAQRAVRQTPELLAYCRSLLAHKTRRILFIPMNPKTDAELMSRLLIEPLRAEGMDPTRMILTRSIEPADVQAIAQACDLIVSSRLHLIILAANVHTPVIGIARGSKIPNYLAPFGLHALGNVYDISAQSLIDESERLLSAEGAANFKTISQKAYLERFTRLESCADALTQRLTALYRPSLPTPEKCIGCSACTQRCPAQALTMVSDEEGFLTPHFDAARCRHCGLCEEVCPVLKPAQPDTPRGYFAARIKDADLRATSSSGGLFSALALETFKHGGKVYGAALDLNPLRCYHTCATNLEELAPLRGSKYTQSDLQGVYTAIAQDLKASDAPVLFSGTPCQIAALNAFLGPKAERVLKVEIICHGVPSILVLQRYVRDLLAAQHLSADTPLSSFDFRSKDKSWHLLQVKLTAAQKVSYEGYDRAFGRAYLSGFCMRPGCYSCPSRDGRSGADFTIADCWGIEHTSAKALDDNRGTSLAILHTERAQAVWQAIAPTIDCLPLTREEAIGRNRSYLVPEPHNARRAPFMRALAQGKRVQDAYRRALHGPGCILAPWHKLQRLLHLK